MHTDVLYSRGLELPCKLQNPILRTYVPLFIVADATVKEQLIKTLIYLVCLI